MAVNLLRNTKVFYTTNLDADGNVDLSQAFANSNTFEIQVLDGFTFTQNTASETITLNEAGATPNRGQRAFNTALEPVEFTMSTYMRPKAVLTGEDVTDITCEESLLWGALGTGKDATSAWSSTASSGIVNFATSSNNHQLEAFGLLIMVDSVTYIVDNCALDQASIDFGLDQLATIAWTGRGTKLRQVLDVTYDGTTGAFTGAAFAAGSVARMKYTDAKFIANKLSVVTMKANIGQDLSTDTLDLPITGGNITFSNNLTYLTPANLGIVNIPVTYFTGTRAISGSMTAYLRTGVGGSSGTILNSLLASSTTEIAPAYTTRISIGGTGANRVVIDLPAAMLSIPTVNAEQVISTTMNFVAHGSATNAYSIEAANEAKVTYYAAP